MKFDSGLTSTEAEEEYDKKISTWHRKFLFFPKRIGYRDCRWLEFIERRRVKIIEERDVWPILYDTWFDGIEKYRWEYRLPCDYQGEVDVP